jgi:RNase H-fold protein (predicted Holliday junction resolvase)
VPALQAVLASQQNALIDMYVANRLLSPLKLSEPQVIVLALPSVKETFKRIGKYERIPQYNKQQRAAMEMPVKYEPEDKARLEAEVQAAQQAKVYRDHYVELHNQFADALMKTVFELMLRSRTVAYDTELVAMLQTHIEKGHLIYMHILESMQTQAAGMSKERAKALYLACKKIWKQMPKGKKTYVNPTKVEYNGFDNSKFAGETRRADKDLLKTINHLATPAGMPALTDRARSSDAGNDRKSRR